MSIFKSTDHNKCQVNVHKFTHTFITCGRLPGMWPLTFSLLYNSFSSWPVTPQMSFSKFIHSTPPSLVCVFCRNAAGAVLCKGSSGRKTSLGQVWDWDLLLQVWMTCTHVMCFLSSCSPHVITFNTMLVVQSCGVTKSDSQEWVQYR